MRSALQAQWIRALEECERVVSFRDDEKELIARFETPQALLAHLKEIELLNSGNSVQRLIAQVPACVSLLQSLSLMLIASMEPIPIRLSLMWGLLSVALEVVATTQMQHGD
jgi:hypothetical protein